jgi:outer membrane protein TolC
MFTSVSENLQAASSLPVSPGNDDVMATSVIVRAPSHAVIRRMRDNAAHLFWIFSVACCLLLNACVVGPKYNRPSVQTPPAYKELGPTAVSTPPVDTWKTAQPKDDAVRGKWWEMFNDPRLNELEEKAATSNQNIAAAAANFLAARALVRQARSQYFPIVTASPSITNLRPSPAQLSALQTTTSTTSRVALQSYTDYSLPFDASWEPDIWGRVRNQVRANVFAAQASAADLQNVRLSEQAELAVDYYELRTQDSLKEILDATVTAYQDSLDLSNSL